MVKKIIIYTAIMGNYNKLREIKNPDKNIIYLCFTDQKIESNTWKIVKGNNSFHNSNLRAKIYKVLPHLYFNCDYSLWVDASIEIYGNILGLINSHIDEKTDLALFRYTKRDCPYCEANIVISSKLANKNLVRSQMNNYYKKGFQLHNGLSLGGVILRKHSKKMEFFNLMWWGEICRYTHRDQLSLDYCINKANLIHKYFNLPKFFENNGYFKYHGHKKNISHLMVLIRIVIAEKNILDFRKIFYTLKVLFREKINKI